MSFDAQESLRRKDEGMTAAAAAKQSLLTRVQQALVALAKSRGEVTADDAHAWLVENGFDEDALGNAAGSLFRSPIWEFTGRWMKSKRPVAHANDLRVWRLRQV